MGGPERRELNAALARLQRLGASRRVFSSAATAAGSALGQQAAAVLRAVPLDGTHPVSSVAAAAQMDVGAVSRQLRVLDDAGMTERRPSTTNASVVLVALTERGRDERARFDAVRSSHLDRALASWTEYDRTELARLLARLVDDLAATPYTIE